MINIPYSSRELNDIYCLFKKDADFKAFLRNENKPTARFRAHDHIDFHTGSSENVGVSHTNLAYLTIRTNANLDFADGDIIYDLKYKIEWRILDNGVEVGDDNQMKMNSMRPRKFTILNLIKRA